MPGAFSSTRHRSQTESRTPSGSMPPAGIEPATHGILFELVLERSPRENPAKTLQRPEPEPLPEDEALVLTAWASHEAFDAWIDTLDRDRLTDSDDHRAVQYQPLTRYDLVGGY